MEPVDLFVLIGTVVNLAVLTGAVVFRKRLLAALGRLLSRGAIEFVQASMWTEVEEEGPDGTVVRKKALSGPARAQLEAVAPVLLQATLKSIKLKSPANLPINPVTGQLDFMAPVLAKVAAGKKVSVEDFLPLIMDKAMPFVEGVLGGLGGKGGAKPSEARNPFLPKELG